MEALAELSDQGAGPQKGRSGRGTSGPPGSKSSSGSSGYRSTTTNSRSSGSPGGGAVKYNRGNSPGDALRKAGGVGTVQ